MLVQLFEDKAKRKRVLDLAARQRARQPLLAQGSVSIALNGGVGRQAAEN
jgi:hypothetical protein